MPSQTTTPLLVALPLQAEIEQLSLLERLGRIQPDEKRQLEEYRRIGNKILVLPGFEFTATLGFHVLAIFPPETSIRTLEHLLIELNVPSDQIGRGRDRSRRLDRCADRLSQSSTEAGGLVSRRSCQLEPWCCPSRARLWGPDSHCLHPGSDTFTPWRSPIWKSVGDGPRPGSLAGANPNTRAGCTASRAPTPIA